MQTSCICCIQTERGLILGISLFQCLITLDLTFQIPGDPAQQSNMALLTSNDTQSADSNNSHSVSMANDNHVHAQTDHNAFMRSKRKRAQSVDNISRTAFPISIIVFNLMYWLIYINNGSKPIV